jgi:hypothetical protein
MTAPDPVAGASQRIDISSSAFIETPILDTLVSLSPKTTVAVAIATPPLRIEICRLEVTTF